MVAVTMPVTGVPSPRIAPESPSPSLLTSARRLTGALDWERDGLNWVTGCQPSFAMSFCPAEPTRDTPSDRDIAHAAPFLIYTPIACDRTTVNMADLPNAARELTDAHTARKLGAALWMGEGLPETDLEAVTLRRAAVDISASNTVYDLDDAVAALLTAYEECTDGEGGAMIHMPSTLIPFALGGGAGGARVCWPEGTLYRGPLKSVVVPGPGYPLGQSADGPDGFGPATDLNDPQQYAGNDWNQSWVYVTGMVEWDATPIAVIPDNEQDRQTFRTNRYEVWGQRQAIVRFDPCCAFAVLVNNPVPPTSEVS